MKALLVALAFLAVSCAPEFDLTFLELPDPEETEQGPTDEPGRVLAQDAVERSLRRGVVRVRNVSCLGVGSGSGFFIEPDVIVSNRHVVEDAYAVEISTWDGRVEHAEISEVAFDSDLAVIRLVRPVENATVLPHGSAAERQAVRVVGFPSGGPFSITEGNVLDFVSGSRFGEGAEQVIRMSNDVQQGNSGGPVVDVDGTVVAVVYAIETATGYGLAIPIEEFARRSQERSFRQPDSQC